MNSKALIIGASLFAGTLGSIAAKTAHADTFITSGVSCVPVLPTNFSLLQYSSNGVSNPSNTDVVVICPVAQKLLPSYTLKFFTSFSPNNRATCNAFGIDDLGNIRGPGGEFKLGDGPSDIPANLLPLGVVLIQCKLPRSFNNSTFSLQALMVTT